MTDFERGYHVCMEHVERLTCDADFLAEKGSYGHALFLFFTAMEEAVKALIYLWVHVGVTRYDTVRKGLRKHLDKTAWFMGIWARERKEEKVVAQPEPSIEKMVASLKTFGEATIQFIYLRESCLYVEPVNGQWHSPVGFQRSDWLSAEEVISEFISFVRKVSDRLLSLPSEELEDILISFTYGMIEDGPSQLDEFYEKGVLNEGEYEKRKAKLAHLKDETAKSRRGFTKFWNYIFKV